MKELSKSLLKNSLYGTRYFSEQSLGGFIESNPTQL
jgi:hypothetical protein